MADLLPDTFRVIHTTAFSSFTPRTMKVYATSGSLTITNLARTGIVTGDSEDSVKITFTKSTGSSSPIIATWGGHLGIGTASSAGYGSLNGAGSITGASFHMTLDKLVVGSGADNLPSGNRARSIQSNAINPAVPPSSIETLEWEKRVVLSDGSHPLIGGATFSISPDPATGTGGPVAVSDCTSLLCLGLDQDDTPGQFLIDVFAAASPGTAYTVTETTAPTGTAIDADADRSVTVTSGFGEVIGTQTTDDDTADEEADFHNTLGSIAWEKRTIYDNGDHLLFGGATFTVTPDPTTGSGFMTVVDNGANDADPAAGKIKVNDVLADTYTVEETVAPTDTAPDPDADREVIVAAGATVSIGDSGVDDNTGNDMADFHNVQFPVVTDSALCRFDKNDERSGDQFRNLFTPAPTNIGYYRDTATNPGQFYYNMFFTGTPGVEYVINVETAYPFVTHGANPIQGHDMFSLNEDGCFVPEGSVDLNVDEEDELSTLTPSDKKAIVVDDYESPVIQTADDDPDQTTTLPFTIRFTMPDSGIVYVTMHLDYAFKHSSSWMRLVGTDDAQANSDNTEFTG